MEGKDRVDVEPVYVSSRDKVKFTFLIDPYLKQLLFDQAKKIGVSSCFLATNYIRAGVTGETVQIPRARPVVVNMRVNYGVERPRRYPRTETVQPHYAPPNCKDVDAFYKAGMGLHRPGDPRVMCGRVMGEVGLEKCWDCFLAKEEIP